jgi:Concanavalin A-like lectin/glucanases superfamily
MARAPVAALVLSLCLLPSRPSAQAPAVTWRLDNLDRIGGHAVRTLGAPGVVQTELGPAVEFNGKTDGLLIDANPIAGLRAFTIELLFQPDAGGPEEQRFLHIEEAGDTGSRTLIELRMLPGGSSWTLDTFLRNREKGLTLLDRSKAHPAAQWHTAALVYDGRVMQHYVNGEREVSGEVEFPIHEGGRTSLGVRQTLVSWFKGRIHTLRVSAAALPPAGLMRAPHRAEAK